MDEGHVEEHARGDEEAGVHVLHLRVLNDRRRYQVDGEHQHDPWNHDWHLRTSHTWFGSNPARILNLKIWEKGTIRDPQ